MSQHFNPLESSFDDLEELMDESAALAAVPKAAKGKAPAPDLDDLDALLEESTALAGAKRAKAQGRKLTQPQSELLEANRLAAEAELWLNQHYYAHITVNECKCGWVWQDFAGWYAAQEQRNKLSRRLVRVTEPGFPRSQYVTYHKTAECPHCLVGLPVATPAQNELLCRLGGC